MKIAINIDQDRIAPLFDVGESFVLYLTDSGIDLADCKVINDTDPLAMNRIIHLARDGVEVLLCGAISRQCMFTGEAMGIKVHSFLSGSYAEVLASFLEKGVPALLKYRMPGCRNAGRRNRRRGRGGRRND